MSNQTNRTTITAELWKNFVYAAATLSIILLGSAIVSVIVSWVI